MFYYLRGTLALNENNTAVVDCGGVGYQLAVSAMTAARLERVGVGEAVTVYTYMAFRQEAVELFGFYDRQELESFKTLIGVNGVGPKAALAILSTLTPEQFAMAVMSGDTRAITRAPGVGPKLASRIALELKDKVDATLVSGDMSDIVVAVEPQSDNAEEAVKALLVLGYSRGQAKSAVAQTDASAPVEEIVRAALRLLMK
jgi:Holliday junction DNA helicase RuvA